METTINVYPVTAVDRIGSANQGKPNRLLRLSAVSTTSAIDIRVRATITIGGANTRLDVDANMRRKSLDCRLRRPLNMGVDVSRCCDRPSVFPVGRSIIIYTYCGGCVSSLQDKVADRRRFAASNSGEVYDVVPPLTDQDQDRAFAAAIDGTRRARFYANRIHLVASATLSAAR